MGTNKDLGAEQSAPEIEEDMDISPEQNSPVDQDPRQPEDGKLLNTYKWHTGANSETVAQGPIERIEKGASNKWNKMQSWRKALSEDGGESARLQLEGAKAHPNRTSQQFQEKTLSAELFQSHQGPSYPRPCPPLLHLGPPAHRHLGPLSRTQRRRVK